jgi:hypothetical protein
MACSLVFGAPCQIPCYFGPVPLLRPWKAIAQLQRVASQIPTEENLKCVQVLDLYSDFYNWEGTSARS